MANPLLGLSPAELRNIAEQVRQDLVPIPFTPTQATLQALVDSVGRQLQFADGMIRAKVAGLHRRSRCASITGKRRVRRMREPTAGTRRSGPRTIPGALSC